MFEDKLGKIQGLEIQLHLRPDATPYFHRPSPVAYFMRTKVELELQRLQMKGIIEQVTFLEWAPVSTRDGSVLIVEAVN